MVSQCYSVYYSKNNRYLQYETVISYRLLVNSFAGVFEVALHVQRVLSHGFTWIVTDSGSGSLSGTESNSRIHSP